MSHDMSMAEVRARVRKWGSSLAAVIPPEVLKAEGISEGDEIVIDVHRVRPLREMFGYLRRFPGPRIDAQAYKDEIRAEERARERRLDAQHRKERRK